MTRRIFTRAEAKAIGLPHFLSSNERLADEHVEDRRWTQVRRLVFRHQGRTWAVHYLRGLTENQDGTDPWDDEDTIEAVEVEQHLRTVTDWLPIGTPASTDPAEHTRRLLHVITAAADPLLRDKPNSPAAALATLISRIATGDLTPEQAEHELARELDHHRRATAPGARRMFTVLFTDFERDDVIAVVLAAEGYAEARRLAETALTAEFPATVYAGTVDGDAPVTYNGEPIRVMEPQQVNPDGGRA